MQRTTKFRGRSGPADGCQHLPNEGMYGIDHIDYSLMRAPRPTAVLAATRDFFDIESTRETCQDAVSVFKVLGEPDRFHFFEAEAEQVCTGNIAKRWFAGLGNGFIRIRVRCLNLRNCKFSQRNKFR